jgi:ATP:corrinoid adenosyltransferase
MPRGKRSTNNLESVEKQIKAAEEKVAAAKQKFDAAKAELKTLQETKKMLQNDELVSAIANSKHSYDDIMNYLNSDVESTADETK